MILFLFAHYLTNSRVAMSLKNFNHWVTKLNYHDFSLSEKEEKIIQITDLNRFLECYNPSLEIVDCLNFDFCIIEENNTQKKIILSDFENINNKTEINSILLEHKNKESWFVFVNDKLDSALKSVIKTIEDHQIKKKYDKVFVFNFFQSNVLELK